MASLQAKGAYSTKALVDAARDPRCPAHADFEWDDSVAGEKWRLRQAGDYERGIEYEVVIERKKTKPVQVNMRVVYPAKDKNGARVKVSGGAVVRDGDLMAQLVDRARSQLASFQNQYKSLRKLSEFAGLFRELDRVLGKPKGKRAA